MAARRRGTRSRRIQGRTSAAAGGGEDIGGKGGGSRSAVLRREQKDEARLALPLPTPRAGGWTHGVFGLCGTATETRSYLFARSKLRHALIDP